MILCCQLFYYQNIFVTIVASFNWHKQFANHNFEKLKLGVIHFFFYELLAYFLFVWKLEFSADISGLIIKEKTFSEG